MEGVPPWQSSAARRLCRVVAQWWPQADTPLLPYLPSCSSALPAQIGRWACQKSTGATPGWCSPGGHHPRKIIPPSPPPYTQIHQPSGPALFSVTSPTQLRTIESTTALNIRGGGVPTWHHGTPGRGVHNNHLPLPPWWTNPNRKSVFGRPGGPPCTLPGCPS